MLQEILKRAPGGTQLNQPLGGPEEAGPVARAGWHPAPGTQTPHPTGAPSPGVARVSPGREFTLFFSCPGSRKLVQSKERLRWRCSRCPMALWCWRASHNRAAPEARLAQSHPASLNRGVGASATGFRFHLRKIGNGVPYVRDLGQ